MVIIPAKKTTKSQSHDELEELHKKLTKTHTTIKDDQKSIRATLDELIRVFKEASKTSKLSERLEEISEQNKHIIDLLEDLHKEKMVQNAVSHSDNQSINGSSNLKQDVQTEEKKQVPIEEMLQSIKSMNLPVGSKKEQSNKPAVTKAPPNKELDIPDYNTLMNGGKQPTQTSQQSQVPQKETLPPIPPEPPIPKQETSIPTMQQPQTQAPQSPSSQQPASLQTTNQQQSAQTQSTPQTATNPAVPQQPQDSHVMPPPIVNNEAKKPGDAKKKSGFMKELETLMGKK